MSAWTTWLPMLGKSLGSGALDVLPGVLSAHATRQAGNDARLEAKMLHGQARGARAQGSADEEAHRRASRIALGRQQAAIAETGGAGGSEAALLEQSAVFAELDARNIRYDADVRGQSFDVAAINKKNRARGSGLLAAGQLLMGTSRAYTSNKIAGG